MPIKSRSDKTTKALVTIYEEVAPQLYALQNEMRDLAKKKPEATMSKGKVLLINRVLSDIKSNFSAESGGKYLGILDEETLPQLSDAVLVIAQHAALLTQFQKRYFVWDNGEEKWLVS